MRTLARLIIRFRFPVILLVLGVTAFLGYQILFLGINADMISYLPADRESVKLHKEIGAVFGGNDLVVAAIHPTDGDVFSQKTLEQIRALTKAYEAASLDGAPIAWNVIRFSQLTPLSQEIQNQAQMALQETAPLARNVISLTNMLDIRSTGDGVNVKKLVPPEGVPESPEVLEELRRYTLNKEMYSGLLVSPSGEYGAIVVRLFGNIDGSDATDLIQQITREKAPELEVDFAGVPVWNHGLSKIIFADMQVLLPIVALLVIFILFLSFRTWRGVLLPLLTVLISTTWTLGLMSLLDVELTMISNVIPVLLIAVGSAYGIHLLNRYREDVGPNRDHKEVIADAVGQVGLAIVLAGVTTFVGFLSFLTAYLTLVREFGIFSAIGVACALFISLTFIPAILSFLNPSAPLVRNPKDKKRSRLVALMERLGDWSVRRRRPIIVLAVVLMAISASGLTRITRNVNMVEYFKPGHPVREADVIMQNHLGGATPMQVRVKGDIRDPFVLKQMFRIEKFLNSHKLVKNGQSMASLIAETHYQMYGKYKVPDSRQKVTALWLMLEGQELLDQMVNATEDQALVQGTIAGIDSYVMIELANGLDQFLAENMMHRWDVVRLEELSPERRDEIEQERIARVAKDIHLDVRKHLEEYAADLDFRSVIKVELNRNPDDPAVKATNADAFVEAMMRYSRGIEAELEAETEEEFKTMEIGFRKLAVSGKISEDGIRKVLLDSFDPELVEEDPEAVDDMAWNMMDWAAEAEDSALIRRLSNAVRSQLPTEIEHEDWLMKSVEGDLWELTDRFAAVTAQEAGDPMAEFDASGMPRIYRELDESLVSSQIQSLLIALLVVFLMLSIQFQSLWAGLLGCVPITFTVMLNFGVMAWMDVPLDISTVLIASLAIGIGIDYTIHFMTRLRAETRKHDNVEEAVRETTQTSGTAITINAVSVAAGFLTLLAASLIPMMNFGWMTALTMMVSAFGALFLIPMFALAMKKARFLRK